MGSVLAQDEVDALLAGVASDEIDIEEDEDEYDPSEVVPFDLTAQDRIIRGRMPTLEIIHDRFVRMFRLSLSTSLRKVVDISVRSTELIKFGEFLKTLPVPSSMNLFRMTPLRGNAIMVLETRLVFTLIDMFFGGNGELEVKAEGREFTEIESRMIKRVIISALEDQPDILEMGFVRAPRPQRLPVPPLSARNGSLVPTHDGCLARYPVCEGAYCVPADTEAAARVWRVAHLPDHLPRQGAREPLVD